MFTKLFCLLVLGLACNGISSAHAQTGDYEYDENDPGIANLSYANYGGNPSGREVTYVGYRDIDCSITMSGTVVIETTKTKTYKKPLNTTKTFALDKSELASIKELMADISKDESNVKRKGGKIGWMPAGYRLTISPTGSNDDFTIERATGDASEWTDDGSNRRQLARKIARICGFSSMRKALMNNLGLFEDVLNKF